MEWVFAIPDNYQDFGGYQLTDFPGGLYAVATSKDTDEECNLAKDEIRKWVSESGCFKLSTEENHYTMNHVITPKVFKEKMGYHLSDNFVPIEVK